MTLIVYTLYALQPLNVNYFKVFKNVFRKAKDYVMEKKKVSWTKWSHINRKDGQGLQVILQKGKKKIKSRICRIWPLNLTTMVGKVGPSDVFTIVLKEEHHENSY
jgi:hypothetical protein